MQSILEADRAAEVSKLAGTKRCQGPRSLHSDLIQIDGARMRGNREATAPLRAVLVAMQALLASTADCECLIAEGSRHDDAARWKPLGERVSSESVNPSFLVAVTPRRRPARLRRRRRTEQR
jgi:hypothetical protein